MDTLKNPEAQMGTIDLQCLCKVIDCQSTKEQVKEEFLRSHEATDILFSLLASEEIFYQQPEPRRHPLIFYYGHTACFYLNKLYDKGVMKQRLNGEYEELFATGVDQMDYDDLDQTHYKWPSVAEVREFRQLTKQHVLKVIDEIDGKICWDSDMWVILMGIEHDRVHLETSATIIRQLPLQSIKPSKILLDCPIYTTDRNKIPVNEMKKVPAYSTSWKRQIDNTNTYGWDNEFGLREINIKEFEASTMLVSNGEYLEFVEDGGYFKKEYWTEEGLKWLEDVKSTKPVFWRISGDDYKLKTINQEIDLPLDWPVQVNNLQASAFCQWKSGKTGKKLKLPSEDEYLAFRDHAIPNPLNGETRSYGNINLEFWSSPCPVNLFKTGEFFDVVGNVWHLTSTALYPLDKFEYHPLYEDYSTPFFDGRNSLTKGGSFITCRNGTFNARHGWRRHFHLFSGFRYISSDNESNNSQAQEQSDQMLDLAIKLHYEDKDSYIWKTVEKIKERFGEMKGNSFTVGCSVGRLCFQLSKLFNHSYGQDFTARFFQIAARIIAAGFMTFKGKKISVENDGYSKEKSSIIRMNPENVNSKKLVMSKLLLLDGFALRNNSLIRALPNFTPYVEQEGFLLIINAVGKNSVNQQQTEILKDFKKCERFNLPPVQNTEMYLDIYQKI